MDSTGSTTIYCLKCRVQKAPKEGTLHIKEVSFLSKKSKTPMKCSRWVAECSECSRPMRRFAKGSAFSSAPADEVVSA
eukprot:m51a1_g13997 hypothetical protein (78) ;mRNA; r:1064031-1064264